MYWIPQNPVPLQSVSLVRHYEDKALTALTTIWRRRYMILLIVAGSLAIAGLLLGAVLQKKFTADTLLQVDAARADGSRPVAPGQSPERGVSLDATAVIESEARVIKSRAIARRVVERLGLQREAELAAPAWHHELAHAVRRIFFASPAGEAAGSPEQAEAVRTEVAAIALMRNVSVANDMRSYLITISFTSGDPHRSALVANAIADEYLRSRAEASAATAQRTSEWLAGQIAETRQSLATAEQAVDAFRRSTGYVEAEPDGAGLQQQFLRELTAQLSAAKLARIAADGRVMRAKAAYASGEVPSAQDLNGAPLIQRLLENETAARKEVADLALIGPKHPGLARANAVLEQIQQQLRSEIERAIGNLEGEARSTAADVATLEARVQDVSEQLIAARSRETQLKSLQAEAATVRARLKLLTESHEQALSLSALASAPAQVVVKAQPIPVPSGPRGSIVLGLALVGGLGAGIAASLLLEKRDTGFRSANQFEAETETRCIGMVPLWSRGQADGERRIFGEAVRLISAALDLHSLSSSAKTILLTSSVPGEGKSLLALALARDAMADGQRVLIVDWRPAERDEAGSNAGATLDQVLKDPERAFFSELADRRLVILRPSGAVPPGEQFGAAVFSDMMQRAREHYDLIIMEAPPVLLVVDFAQLSRHAESVIHVVSWHGTHRRTVGLALRRMRDFSVKLHGAVLTNVDMKAHRDFRIEDQCAAYRRYEGFFARRELSKAEA
ncbi:GumC family protein [Enterovirga aerilata]|uniref:Lipopolysaccharide biosynthesis protein n=1 Tax=Enterovirga aerilata TaxID=2730920 RepID=A0A849I9U0_9HYPH|nr:exopolysaccharide transport family protein [Enterovirga sp. DB1703]NNM74071.1 lipopolysaccharide biosynthesis protein [Enterovirga sp. DB1703]